jgi:hypothetical protein
MTASSMLTALMLAVLTVSLASWGLERRRSWPNSGASGLPSSDSTQVAVDRSGEVRRTRDLPVTRDGQRAAAATVDEGALTTRLTGLTPARMLHDRDFFLSPRSQKKNLRGSLRASVRTVGDGEQACELTRRSGLIAAARRSQAGPSSTGGPRDPPTPRSGSGSGGGSVAQPAS